MLGEVKAIERNALHIRLDGAGAEASAEASFVKIPINDYQAIDHGYATTIHKNQGATVDRAFVLASGTWTAPDLCRHDTSSGRCRPLC